MTARGGVRGGCYSRRSWWALCLVLVAWLGSPSDLSASEAPISPDSLTPYVLTLQRADALLTTLEQALETRSGEALALQGRLTEAGKLLGLLRSELAKQSAELSTLRVSLDDSETQRALLAAGLKETRVSLEVLTTRFAKLSVDYSDYRQAVERVTRSRDVWRLVGLGAIVVAVVCAILAAVQ